VTGLTGAGLWALASCQPASAPELHQQAARVDAIDVRSVPLDGLFPTAIETLEDGQIWVLDGANRRVIVLGEDLVPLRELTGDAVWGRPVGLARRPGGAWLVDPGDEDRDAALVALSLGGERERVLAPASGLVPPLAPLALVETEHRLVGADRLGRLAFLDRRGASFEWAAATSEDGEPFGTLTDVVETPTGWLAVDASRAMVHRIDATGDWLGALGGRGLVAGRLMSPRAAARTPAGNVLVVDATLGALQLFAPEGTFLGLVAEEGRDLDLSHPVSLTAAPWDPSIWLVLNAAPAGVTSLRLTADAEADAVAQAQDARRSLRELLIPVDDELVGACSACHDGFLNDSRHVWSPDGLQHPLSWEGVRSLPAMFTLDEAGDLTCGTCHSPHGVVTLTELQGMEDASPRLAQTRHASPDAPFTRLRTDNSALCVACHEDAAHEAVVARLALGGGSHPVGVALEQALADRTGTTNATTSCLGCHAPHGALAEPMLRDEGSSLCAPCHVEQSRGRNDHPLGSRIGADLPRSARSSALVWTRSGGLGCRTCHDLVGGDGSALLAGSDGGLALCLTCHDERKGLAAGPHGRLDGRHGVPCLACHDLHGRDLDAHLLQTIDHATPRDPQGCAACHEVHGTAGHPVPAGTDDEPGGCSACHDAHLASSAAGADCGTCHEEQQTRERWGGHGGLTCLDCHPAHADRVSAPAENVASAPCLSCHGPQGEATEVGDVDHPATVFTPEGLRWQPVAGLPLFDSAGESVADAVNGALACGSCHGVHGPESPDGPESLRLSGWRAPCSACHGADAIALYLNFHRPDRWPSEGSP